MRTADAILTVRDGELTEEAWVYVWQSGRDQRVVHVGATFLPPQVRTWLHLKDHRPAVGHIAATYAALADDHLDVLAFRVGQNRAAVRRALAAALRDADLLSDNYVGAIPEPAPDDPQIDVADLVEAVRCHTVA